MKASEATPQPVPTLASALTVHLLGPTDYESCLLLQQRLVYELSDTSVGCATLLVCEHPPLITIGRQGSSEHVLAERAELVSRALRVRWVNRGGGCWVHLPGQLAVYPILPLKSLGLGLSEYTQRLERALVGALGEFDIRAEPRRKEHGIWARCGQLAAVGFAVKQWVSYHGLFLNVAPGLEPFGLVRTSSNGSRVSSVVAERCRPVKMPMVREALVRHLTEQLGFAHYHVTTGHPLLRPQKRTHVHATAVG